MYRAAADVHAAQSYFAFVDIATASPLRLQSVSICACVHFVRAIINCSPAMQVCWSRVSVHATISCSPMKSSIESLLELLIVCFVNALVVVITGLAVDF